jgi:hypothetical protein
MMASSLLWWRATAPASDNLRWTSKLAVREARYSIAATVVTPSASPARALKGALRDFENRYRLRVRDAVRGPFFPFAMLAAIRITRARVGSHRDFDKLIDNL